MLQRHLPAKHDGFVKFQVDCPSFLAAFMKFKVDFPSFLAAFVKFQLDLQNNACIIDRYTKKNTMEKGFMLDSRTLTFTCGGRIGIPLNPTHF